MASKVNVIQVNIRNLVLSMISHVGHQTWHPNCIWRVHQLARYLRSQDQTSRSYVVILDQIIYEPSALVSPHFGCFLEIAKYFDHEEKLCLTWKEPKPLPIHSRKKNFNSFTGIQMKDIWPRALFPLNFHFYSPGITTNLKAKFECLFY